MPFQPRRSWKLPTLSVDRHGAGNVCRAGVDQTARLDSGCSTALSLPHPRPTGGGLRARRPGGMSGRYRGVKQAPAQPHPTFAGCATWRNKPGKAGDPALYRRGKRLLRPRTAGRADQRFVELSFKSVRGVRGTKNQQNTASPPFCLLLGLDHQLPHTPQLGRLVCRSRTRSRADLVHPSPPNRNREGVLRGIISKQRPDPGQAVVWQLIG